MCSFCSQTHIVSNKQMQQRPKVSFFYLLKIFISQTLYTGCTGIKYKIVHVTNCNKYLHYGTSGTVGRVAQSVQRLATGWMVRGLNPCGGRNFPHLSRPALGPTQSPVQRAPRLSQGVKSGRGVTLTPHPPLYCHGHERVELYLYSPYEPYGLYRTSVPVKGRTLPLPLPQRPACVDMYFVRFSLCERIFYMRHQVCCLLIKEKRPQSI